MMAQAGPFRSTIDRFLHRGGRPGRRARCDRLGHRGAVRPDRRGSAARHETAPSAPPRRSTTGPGRGSRTPSAPATCGRSATGLQERDRDLGQLWPASRGRCTRPRSTRADRGRRDLRHVRRAGRHVPVRGGVPTDGRRRVRSARARTGRRRRCDHPVERAGRAHRAQDRTGAPRPGARSCSRSSPRHPARGTCSPRSPQAIGLPPGVLNVVTADREVSELLVRDPRRQDHVHRLDGRGTSYRVHLWRAHEARCTLELGGKSAAVILDDTDLAAAAAAKTLCRGRVLLTGQVCSSLTRIIVTRKPPRRARRGAGRSLRPGAGGRPVRRATQMGPLVAMSASATASRATSPRASTEGATLATGGGRPQHLDRGWFVEPTVFGNVDNSSTIAQEEIFGPVLSVIPADNDEHAVDIANDTIYGLNASVFTDDVERAREVAGPAALRHRRPQRVPHRLRHGVRRLQAVGHRPLDEDGHPRGTPEAHQADI